MIRKDLNSQNQYDAGVALSGLSCFISADLSRDLANDIMTLVRIRFLSSATQRLSDFGTVVSRVPFNCFSDEFNETISSYEGCFNDV